MSRAGARFFHGAVRMESTRYRRYDTIYIMAKVVDSQKAWAKRVGAYELTNAPDYAGAYRHYFGEPV